MSDEKVIVTKSKLDSLATSISNKSGVETPLTIAEMKTAVDSISTGSGGSGTITIEEIPNATGTTLQITTNGSSGGGGSTPSLQTKSVSYIPTTNAQTATVTADTGYDGLEQVNVSVEAIPSEYIVPSGVLSVTENGTYNVEAFARAEVMISSDEDNNAENSIIERTISGEYVNNEVTSIGNYAFAYCSSLTTVSFPQVSLISDHAFYSCSNLKTVSFPQVSSISGYAFYSCSSLTTVDFPQASCISNSAFAYCKNLTTVSFPQANYIGNNAFAYCSSLTTASFPQVSSIGNYAFSSCINLTRVNFPQVSSIGYYAFGNCKNLTTVSFPQASYISGNAFTFCSGLTTVNFPQVSYIGNSAFASCRSLTTAIFYHSSTTQVQFLTYTFGSCYHLLSLYLLASTVYGLTTSSTVFPSTPISNYTTSTGGVYGSIFVPQSLYDTYISSTNWVFYSSRFVGLTDEQVEYVKEHGTHIIP